MATAAPRVARSPGMENIIKQGYLKKSVQSNDLLPSAPKQMANNIKQKLEPNRWYVFGTRNRKPYLELYETEESVFRSQPIGCYDLSTFESLSFTLGRTNTTYTFCIFLSDRTIELTAPNRPQMVDWCRTIEGNMRNLGLRSKHGKEDHQYTAFPVKRPAPSPNDTSPSAEVRTSDFLQFQEDDTATEENPYEEPPDGLKRENSNDRNSLELPPRLPKRAVTKEEEDVFVSLYSVQRNTLDKTGTYHLFDYDTESENPQQAVNGDNADAENTQADDDSDDDAKDNDDAAGLDIDSNDKKATSKVLVDVGVYDDDGDEDRCTSLPIIPSYPPESDTSEDSDFISASFWLRNRKTEDLILLDDFPDLETAKRRLPPLPKNEVLEVPPPVPLRFDSNSVRSSRLRNCVSMNVDMIMHGRRSPTLMTMGKAPLPGKVAEAKLIEVDDDTRKIEANKNKDVTAIPKSSSDPKIKLSKSVSHSLQESIKLPERAEKISNEKTTSNQDKTQAVNSDSDDKELDEDAYELLSCKQDVSPKLKVAGENVYGTAWSSDKNNDDCSKECNKLVVDVMKSKHDSQIKADANQSKHTGKISKFFSKRSSTKELPEALTVNLPHDSSDRDSATGEDAEFNETNLYTDFPTADINTVDGSRPSNHQSDIIKLSLENGPKIDPNISPVLPRRYLKNDKEKKVLPAPPCVASIPSKRKTFIAKTDFSKSVNENWKPLESPPSKSADGSRLSPDDSPVAPPRRNRKTLSGADVEYLADSGIHRTIICNSMDSSAILKERPPPLVPKGSPPIPKKTYLLEKQEPTEPAVPLRNGAKGEANRPALPLPRRSVLRHPEVEHNLGTELVGGTRPKSGIHLSTRQQISNTGAVTVMNLKQNQIDILRSEIESTGGMVRLIPKVHFQNGLILVEFSEGIWIAGWDLKKYPKLYDKFHIGDQVTAINDVQVTELAFAQKLVKNVKADNIEVTVRRLPNARAFAIQRSAEGECIGVKREGGTAEIIYVDPNGLASRHGLSSRAVNMEGNDMCTWMLTEINMRPLNLFFKDKEIEHRLMAVGRDISIVVQPSDFIKELKRLLKKTKGYKDFLVQ